MVLILLISLGFWQLNRAEQKKIELALIDQRFKEKTVKIDAFSLNDIARMRYREISAQGVYDSQHQFLLDNQIVNGKPGYFVMTPLRLHDSDKAILVNRGWIALKKYRNELPEIPLHTIKVQIYGRINNFPKPGLVLPGAEIPTDNWPAIVQVVNTDLLQAKLGYALYNYQIELDPQMPDGFVRQWRRPVILSPERHIAYALQWFGLALTLTLLFFWNSLKKATHE